MANMPSIRSGSFTTPTVTTTTLKSRSPCFSLTLRVGGLYVQT